jgi:hypothetical protein
LCTTTPIPPYENTVPLPIELELGIRELYNKKIINSIIFEKKVKRCKYKNLPNR